MRSERREVLSLLIPEGSLLLKKLIPLPKIHERVILNDGDGESVCLKHPRQALQNNPSESR
jgi:hypothetical protein